MTVRGYRRPEFDPRATPALYEDTSGRLLPVKILSGPTAVGTPGTEVQYFCLKVTRKHKSLVASFDDPFPPGTEFYARVDSTIPRACIYIPKGQYIARIKLHKWKDTQ
jgi:hypothetical protein